MSYRPLPPSGTRVTLREIAKQSGFSVSTVSMVLNKGPLARYFAPDTRAKVERIAKQLRYRPNSYARSLRKQRSDIIGVITFDITDPFCGSIFRGIEAELAQTPYLPMIMDVHGTQQRFEECIEVMLDRRAQALIVVANWLCLDLRALAKIDTGMCPIIVAGREFDSRNISSIATDNYSGAAAALGHLLESGHRKIAFLRGPSTLVDSQRRWDGIIAEAWQRKFTVDPVLTLEVPQTIDSYSCLHSGYQLTKSLLKLRRKFTAIHAFDDMTALGSIRALQEAGMSVPKDVSVIGFDDIPEAMRSFPPLSTVRQPMKRIGAASALSILSSINPGRNEANDEDPDADAQQLSPELTLMQPELVVRQSTRRL